MSLDVCKTCGWYLGAFSQHECKPRAGAAADRLAAEVGLKHTKLGYGDSRLTFEVGALTLVLGVSNSARSERVFTLDDTFMHSYHNHADIKELLLAIAGTKIGGRK